MLDWADNFDSDEFDEEWDFDFFEEEDDEFFDEDDMFAVEQDDLLDDWNDLEEGEYDGGNAW